MLYNLSTNCKIKSLDCGLQLDLPLSIGNSICVHMYSPTAKSPWEAYTNQSMASGSENMLIKQWRYPPENPYPLDYKGLFTWEIIHTVTGSLSCAWYFGFSFIIGSKLINTSGFRRNDIANTTNMATYNSNIKYIILLY